MSRSDASLLGPQALVDRGTTKGVNPSDIKVLTDDLRGSVQQALVDAGLSAAAVASFDPVTTPMRADHTGVDAVLDVLVHNRGYDNNSGAPAAPCCWMRITVLWARWMR